MSATIQKLTLGVPDNVLENLRQRLIAAQYPRLTPDNGWERGVPEQYVKSLCEYWMEGYDWRAAEAEINSLPNFQTTLDGTRIHFVHARSPRADAVPMIMTHGWPGSFIDFLDVIGPLTDPERHGGSAEMPAFHLVIPSLPGAGLSGAPATACGVEEIADLWIMLMERLGYDDYLLHGEDWGMPISMRIAKRASSCVRGVHVTSLVTFPPGDASELSELSDEDIAHGRMAAEFAEDGFGFQKILSTRPNTLAFALADSPTGLLAWIVEKFYEWSSARERPDEVFDRDRLLTTVMIHWVTASAASAAQIYYESSHLPSDFVATWGGPFDVPAPVGVMRFADDPAHPVKAWAPAVAPSLMHWTDVDHGGHFGAMECPDEVVADLRRFARQIA